MCTWFTCQTLVHFCIICPFSTRLFCQLNLWNKKIIINVISIILSYSSIWWSLALSALPVLIGFLFPIHAMLLGSRPFFGVTPLSWIWNVLTHFLLLNIALIKTCNTSINACVIYLARRKMESNSYYWKLTLCLSIMHTVAHRKQIRP